MASIKIVFKKEKSKSDGEIPMYLRITKDRRAKFISLGISLHPDYWNAKEKQVKTSHPNSAYLNNYLTKKIFDAQKITLEMETNSEYVPPRAIKQAVMGKTTEKFIPYAERYVTNLKKRGKIGTYDKANATVSKLKEYIGNKDFTFGDMTIFFLKKYEEYLRDNKNNCANTINSNMKVIRRIVNEAINDEIFPPEKNPFLRYKLKWEKTEIEFLTENDVKALDELVLPEGSMKYHHRNIYVFACYAAGLRISDICQLKWENFDGERILLNTMKTGSVVTIKLPQKALDVVSLYKKEDQQPNHYIFPFLNNDTDFSDPMLLFKTISSMTSYTNSDLKDIAKLAGINQKLHFHTSRHTFATRALRKGMRIEYVSKLMGHSSIKTTQIYAKIVNKDLDDAMDVFKD